MIQRNERSFHIRFTGNALSFQLYVPPPAAIVIALVALLAAAAITTIYFTSIGPVTAAHGSSCHTPLAGLVHCWPGDDDANDIVGTNHGTLVNGAATTTSGKVGGAFVFDGVDDYIDLVSQPDISTTSGFTVAGWVNFNSANINNCRPSAKVGHIWA